jgi:hypothetical protein
MDWHLVDESEPPYWCDGCFGDRHEAHEKAKASESRFSKWLGSILLGEDLDYPSGWCDPYV